MFGFIYITTNKVNGRKYLGQARYGKKGWRNYLGSGLYIKAAITKYGEDSFTRTIIAETTTREALTALENNFLRVFDCAADPLWYNIQPKAHASFGGQGKTRSPETMAKVKAKLTGRKRSEKEREAMRGPRKPRSIESRRKHSHTLLSYHANAKSVTVSGIKYRTLTEAEKATGISYYMLRKLLKNAQECGSDRQRVGNECSPTYESGTT